ncbi:hypothetical protein [Chelativorans sp. YIM 93263]|uniref:hypothetical protein n=1 Tax=Chelativorans sp. YIM 93263 TaxID=2906648 RepID=UPI00403D84A2
MRELHRAYPDDLDIAALFAEAMMNRTPYALWDLSLVRQQMGIRMLTLSAKDAEVRFWPADRPSPHRISGGDQSWAAGCGGYGGGGVRAIERFEVGQAGLRFVW